MQKIIQTDIAIIGGGIAGLWLLNRLRQCGFSAILLESDTLGGGQTHQAQGIIHGGMKYALQGKLTSAAQAIAKMPAVWQACLHGQGDIDLSKVSVLSPRQYLWSTASLTSKMAAFFASVALKNKITLLDKASFPSVFQDKLFHGHVYALDEIVIDVHSLLRELMRPHREVIFKIDPMEENHIELTEEDCLVSLKVQAAPMQALQVKAQKYIFTAGAGNELFIKKLKHTSINMQRRPLQMVVVKHDLDCPLYAHCLGLSSTPRMTITTHKAHDGKSVWYMGGHIAEEGVKLNSDEQIGAARKELKNLFPWLDFSHASFASFHTDRAENLAADGSRPDSFYLKEIENMMIAWPTKLAFAPLLADAVIQRLTEASIVPRMNDLRELRAWPMPAIASPVWDRLLP